MQKLIYFFAVFLFFLGSYYIGRPYLADSYYRKGLILENTRKWQGALEKYRQAIELDPNNAEYYCKLADLCFRRSRFGLHAEFSGINFGLMAEDSPVFREDFLSLARKYYEKAIRLCPRNANYWTKLGMALEKLSAGSIRRKNSLPFLSQEKAGADNIYLPTLKCYQKAIELDPCNAFYHVNLGSFYLRRGNYSQGLKEYEEAVAIFPEIELYDFLKGEKVSDQILDAAIKGLRRSISSTPQENGLHQSLGDLYAKKKMFKEAIIAYKEEISYAKNPFRLYILIGNLYAGTGEVEESRKNYRKAIKADPKNIKVYICLSDSFKKAGRIDEAILATKKGIEQIPGNTDLHYRLSNFYLQRNQLDKVVSQYEIIKRLNPRNPRIYNQLSGIFKKKDLSDKALLILEEGVENLPDNPYAHYYLGLEYRRRERYHRAAGELGKAVSLAPDNHNFHYQLAYTHSRRPRMLEKTIKEYEKAVKLKPDSSRYRYYLGESYRKKGRYKAAKKQYEEALKLSPGNEDFSRALASIEKRKNQNSFR